MMKINLSGDKEGKKSNKTPVAFSASEGATLKQKVPEELLAEEKNDQKSKKSSLPLLMVLLIVLIAAVVYLKRDFIVSFLPKKSPVIQPVATPPPAPPPKVEVVEAEPDPTFVAMSKIAGAVTPRLWLTSALIKYDGTYQVRGIAFSYKSMNDMVAALEGIGTVTAKTIPGQSKSPETVYQFSVDGNIAGIKPPEILDVIPTGDLVADARTAAAHEKEFGIRFSRVPQAGRTYTDKDMPFTLEGPYEGLKKVISLLCPEDGKTRVFSLTIVPSSPGRTFDRVRASFSLKRVSAI